ncbi:hypothetical protein [Megasphaera sp.]|uniref:hypothetical protein n=1 Tax=Megasphaera sp. TaxID=2023260 RepID=UPI001D6582B3|nr:hypothetical protein [Megasphaera sp.]MBS6103682.1 hypothetical protein [Megasphaera sp.]
MSPPVPDCGDQDVSARVDATPIIPIADDSDDNCLIRDEFQYRPIDKIIPEVVFRFRKRRHIELAN